MSPDHTQSAFWSCISRGDLQSYQFHPGLGTHYPVQFAVSCRPVLWCWHFHLSFFLPDSAHIERDSQIQMLSGIHESKRLICIQDSEDILLECTVLLTFPNFVNAGISSFVLILILLYCSSFYYNRFEESKWLPSPLVYWEKSWQYVLWDQLTKEDCVNLSIRGWPTGLEFSAYF